MDGASTRLEQRVVPVLLDGEAGTVVKDGELGLAGRQLRDHPLDLVKDGAHARLEVSRRRVELAAVYEDERPPGGVGAI